MGKKLPGATTFRPYAIAVVFTNFRKFRLLAPGNVLLAFPLHYCVKNLGQKSRMSLEGYLETVSQRTPAILFLLLGNVPVVQ